MCLFKGSQGIQGTNGTQGVQGFVGFQGVQGPMGISIDSSYINAQFKEYNDKIKAINSSLNNTIDVHSLFYTIADVPLTSTSQGITNSIACDSSYLYICVDKNKWLRTSLNIW